MNHTHKQHLSSNHRSRGDLNIQPEYLPTTAESSDPYNSNGHVYQQSEENYNNNNISSLSSNDHHHNTSTTSIGDNLSQAYRIPGLNYSNLSFKPQGYSSNDTTNHQLNDISNLFKSSTNSSSKGVFKIVGRVRPPNKSSYLLTEGNNKIMEIGEDHKTILIGKYLNKSNPSLTSFQFSFDRVFDELANQSLFYSSCAYPLFKSFVGGVNANIITYGQVSCFVNNDELTD